MKYQSGNARRAPTRGAFAFEFLPIEFPPLFLTLLEHFSFVPLFRSGRVLEMNFPVALERRWPISFVGDTSVLPIAPREKEKSNDFAVTPTCETIERLKRFFNDVHVH